MKTQNRKTPQLEDGYTRIANQLLDDLALKIHLSGNEWKVVLIVIRKTYGFNKKMDAISLTQFQKMIGLSRPSVVEAIKKLVGKNLLVINKEPYKNLYSLNKDSGLWLTSKDIGTSRGFGIKLVGKKEHTIEIIQKKINNKIFIVSKDNKKGSQNLTTFQKLPKDKSLHELRKYNLQEQDIIMRLLSEASLEDHKRRQYAR